MSTAPTRVRLGMPTVRPVHGEGEILLNTPFPESAREQLGNGQMRANIRRATHTIRAKRAGVVEELPDWQELRAAGSALKQSVMADLPALLERLESEVTARGGVVHWARDAAEARRARVWLGAMALETLDDAAARDAIVGGLAAGSWRRLLRKTLPRVARALTALDG